MKVVKGLRGRKMKDQILRTCMTYVIASVRDS
jgi:hypothetical protein